MSFLEQVQSYWSKALVIYKNVTTSINTYWQPVKATIHGWLEPVYAIFRPITAKIASFFEPITERWAAFKVAFPRAGHYIGYGGNILRKFALF